MIASILPRSTSTVRVSLPCWTTPETMSPSTPAKWPYFCSSSASRSRCMMTWRAVEAATRPKPRGCVVLADPVALLVELGHQHVDVAGLAVELDPGAGDGALGLLVRGEQGLLDRAGQHLERQVLLPLHQPQHGDVDVHLVVLTLGVERVGFERVGAVELDLDQGLGDLGVAELAGLTRRRRAATASSVARDDPAGQLSPGRGRDLDQPADVAPPVPGQLERAADPAGGDLERVRGWRPVASDSSRATDRALLAAAMSSSRGPCPRARRRRRRPAAAGACRPG